MTPRLMWVGDRVHVATLYTASPDGVGTAEPDPEHILADVSYDVTDDFQRLLKHWEVLGAFEFEDLVMALLGTDSTMKQRLALLTTLLGSFGEDELEVLQSVGRRERPGVSDAEAAMFRQIVTFAAHADDLIAALAGGSSGSGGGGE